MKYALPSMLLFFLAACQTNINPYQSQAIHTSMMDSDQWSEYWYAGEAEISVYEGDQTRYSERHPGKAVLIFVTEDFLTDEQVKNESGQQENSASVLKTNLALDFTTGIYDYNIMNSVFTPIDQRKHPNTLKITTSVQDWCGQSFVQLNHKGNKYQVQLLSYFEKEGDANYKVENRVTEDELLNRIRLNPNTLPTGKFEIIPGTIFSLLKHVPLEPVTVEATQGKYSGRDMHGANLQQYVLQFDSFDRTLAFIYEAEFPHAIVGWKDAYPSVVSGEKLTTVYRRVSTIKSPYWSKHDLEHMPLRAEIGLD
ncbi:MAG: hypothetical protein HKN87_21360 [Saprospiraceae bacterium]|nr:hypothetical protein [Saprospiraceae bacterium]